MSEWTVPCAVQEVVPLYVEGRSAAYDSPALCGRVPVSVLQTWGYQGRGLYSTLPIPHCANSVLYVDYTEMPNFGGYFFALVVSCGLIRFTRVFPCTKHITGGDIITILLKEWFCVYGAPKEATS